VRSSRTAFTAVILSGAPVANATKRSRGTPIVLSTFGCIEVLRLGLKASLSMTPEAGYPSTQSQSGVCGKLCCGECPGEESRIRRRGYHRGVIGGQLWGREVNRQAFSTGFAVKAGAEL